MTDADADADADRGVLQREIDRQRRALTRLQGKLIIANRRYRDARAAFDLTGHDLVGCPRSPRKTRRHLEAELELADARSEAFSYAQRVKDAANALVLLKGSHV